MRDPGPLFRRLYQHVKATAGLPGLHPRPLAADQIVPGASEFVITRGEDLPGGGWGSGGLLIPRRYLGYVAVHYARDSDQHGTFTDEANILRALVTFGDLPDVARTTALRQLGDTPADWFLNRVPEQAGLPAVLTLSFDFNLDLDLELQETP